MVNSICDNDYEYDDNNDDTISLYEFCKNNNKFRISYSY